MLIVKKFGGTSVGDKQRMYNVANRCIEEYKKGNDVVVVLSAMGDVRISDGHGNAQAGRSGGFPECFSGDHAYHKQPSECKIEKN